MTSTALRFRHNAALTVAAVVVMLALISVLTWAPILLVLEVFPFAIAVWGWRSGTDVDQNGLTVRALLGRRHVPWGQVRALVTDGRGRVNAQLAHGGALPLPAVGRDDLPRLVDAAGAAQLVNDPR